MKAKPPTKKQRARWERIRELGCMVGGLSCKPYTEIHHAGTGGGGRKDHDKVFGLCYNHHSGEDGIHTISRRVWQERYGTENHFLNETANLLGEI